MGHVSNFNGMNTCDEADLNQATSDLISADNILDSLNENFLPIYNSFPDDIYRHPNLYASSNLTSFVNNDDDDRNGYFDEPLELDLLLDSDNFNFDFDTSEPVLENEQQILQNDPVNDFNLEACINERNGNRVHFKQENEAEVSELKTCIHGSVSRNDVNSQGNQYTDNFETTGPSESKTYTVEPVFKNSEPSAVKSEEIPKIIIRLKPESKCIEQDFIADEASPPLTIADNVKLGRRRNGNLKCDDSGQIVTKDVNKHKTHKKKSRHKKRHSELKNKICEINQKFSTKLSNCNTLSFSGENIFFNPNATINADSKSLKTFENCSSEFKSSSNCQLSNDNVINCKNSSTSVNRDLHLHTSDHVLNNLKNNCIDYGAINKTGSEGTVQTDKSFVFDFENTVSTSLPLSINVKKEVEDFLEDINTTLDHGNIPDLNKPLLEEIESVKSVEGSLSSVRQKEEFNSPLQTEKCVANHESAKSSSVSELIEELNAHNQQVFEEIEISTPELELELNDAKNSTNTSLESSHKSKNSANDIVAKQNKTVIEHGENDMNSQNHLSSSKISLCAQTLSASHSTTNNHSGTARPRNVSSSSSSVTSKSSSHRSYRKRRISSSSDSSSSDREKFYNRPVKYDPVTQTYCDEFGREIRPNELKYYLGSKTRPQDSYSNNGSSSSSRSKSPRYVSYHKKHHKSRSSSRSHRRRKYSSSRSRSHSHGRKYKVDDDRRYRSPSPKHRSKRHYLEIEENMKAYEERRVMYVGDIPPDYTVEQLKDRFSRFGPIQTASIKSKITADGSLYIFGFVTFKNRSDVCLAIERGNENPSWPRFDLNFGGRRRFCNGNYTDLDGKVAEAESGWYSHQNLYRQQPSRQEDDFAELLKQEQRRLGMSKK